MTLDLKDNLKLVAEYRAYHERVWPEVLRSLKAGGIEEMEIYLRGNQLVMILDTVEGFSFGGQPKNSTTCQWEELMGKYQQGLPPSRPRWQQMERVFELPN